MRQGRNIWSIQVAILSAVGVAGTAAATEDAAVAVRIAKVQAVKVADKDEVVGTLFPARMVPLGFELGGRLAKIRASKGATVKEGQVVASLDTEIADAQVAQAQAGVAAAEAQAALALDVASRNVKLQAEGSVSDLQNKGSLTTSKQAEAQVALAKAQLAQALAARKRHDLKAPFSGTVIDAPDQIGGIVGPGVPVFVIQDLDTLTLKSTVPESARGRMKVGSKLRVMSVSTGLATDEATLKVVIPSADPQTRRIPIEISVPNASSVFTANTLAKAYLTLGQVGDAFTIPPTALGTAGGEHVFVVRNDNTLGRIGVAVLERSSTAVTVRSGELLDRVVDYPTSTLREGGHVTVVAR